MLNEAMKNDTTFEIVFNLFLPVDRNTINFCYISILKQTLINSLTFKCDDHLVFTHRKLGILWQIMIFFLSNAHDFYIVFFPCYTDWDLQYDTK